MVEVGEGSQRELKGTKNGYRMVTPSLKGMKIQDVSKGEAISTRIPKRLFTIREASTYLGKGVFGVRQMIWQGILPVVRDTNGHGNNKKMLIDVRDLDAWIDRNKTYV